MAFTQANLSAIDAALAAGVLTVEYDGKRITYQKVTELIAARAVIVADLARTAQNARPRSAIAFVRD
jgi:hypothetical protein